MAKTVHICGLFRADIPELSSLSDGQVWTVNDWYRCYPKMTPDRVFNLHTKEALDESLAVEGREDRFPGDYISEYHMAAESGTQFVLLEQWGIANEMLYPADRIFDFLNGHKVQFCGITAMILLAVLEKYEKICLWACPLRDNEYRYQIQGILKAIKIARFKGVEVECEYETDWAVRLTSTEPDVAKTYDDSIALLAERLRIQRR